VILPYLPGYGTTRFLSDGTFRNGQQAALARDAVDLLDALGVEHAKIAGFDWACLTFAPGPGSTRPRCRILSAVLVNAISQSAKAQVAFSSVRGQRLQHRRGRDRRTECRLDDCAYIAGAHWALRIA
jgi:pimeloyl-ACP methyl ester carboxylesterase